MESGSKLKGHWSLGVYAVLHMLPFVWSAATWDGFWTSVAPFSTLLALGVLVALFRRRRWAWVVLFALDVLVLVSFIWDPADAVAFVTAAVRLALLLSPPVRSYLEQSEPRVSPAHDRSDRSARRAAVSALDDEPQR